MKKFYFSLDSVLRYKEQVLDSLKNDHANMQARVAVKEQDLTAARNCHRQAAVRFDDHKKNGTSINELRQMESYLQSMDRRIEKMLRELELLKSREAEKRVLVIEANKETVSMQKLREKKLEQYLLNLRKKEEAFIEDFVSHTRIRSIQG